MQSLALVANGFARRLPKSESRHDRSFPGRRLNKYLANQVVPAVDELLRLPDFRSLATAPLETLDPKGESCIRPFIDELKDAIGATIDLIVPFVDLHAELLAEHMENAVRRWRRAQFPNRTAFLSPQAETARGAARNSAVESLRSRLAGIRSRCDDEWISADDYFGPLFDVFVKDGDHYLQRGEFIIAFSDELAHIGNFIGRCLLVRSESTIGALLECIAEINTTFIAANCRATFPWNAQRQQLVVLTANLRTRLLHTEQAKLHEAAMILVQIHAGFAAVPPTYPWLPVADWIVHRRRGEIQHVLESQQDRETAEQIEQALQLVRDWRERLPSGDAVLEAAIASGGLVQDENRRRVFWESQLITADWSRCRQPWDLLRRLVLKRGRSFLAEHEFYDTERERSHGAYAVLKNKLKNLLPPSLGRRLVTAPHRGGYRLDLDPDQIHLIGAESTA